MRKLSIEQIAIGNYHYTSRDLEYFIDSVKNIGVKNVEIWGAKPHFLVGIQSQTYLQEAARKIKDAGLKVVCFCPEQNNYPVNITSAESDLRNWSIEHLKRSIEAAALLGAETMLLCPGNGTLNESPEVMRDRFVSSVRELTQTAADHNVILALETQAKVDALFMNTVSQQKEVLDIVDHPNFKMMIDTVQMAQFNENMAEDLEILGMENVQHIHLGNTVLRRKTWHENRPDPNLAEGNSVCGHIGFREGNLPLLEYLENLADHGYNKYVTIEICQKPYYFEADRYAREAFEYIQPVIRK